MRSWKPFLLSLLAVGLLVAARPASAQTVLISNLHHDLTALEAINSSGATLGQSFVTDGVAHTLHSFDARLAFGDSTLPSQITATLHSVDGDGGVGAAVQSLGPASSLGGDTYRFAGASFALTPSTKYFVVLGMAGDGYAEWFHTTYVTKQGPGAYSGTKTTAFSGNSGAAWSYASLGSGVRQFQVNVTDASPAAVPEPGALWLFLPALGAVAILRRRRA